MKILNSVNEVAKEIGCNWWKIQERFENNLGHGYFMVDGITVYVHNLENDFEFVIVDEDSNADCRKYFMKYLAQECCCKVYVDDIEKWQDAEVLDITNMGFDITRAVVRTKANTQLYRRVKYIEFVEELKPDGCIYLLEKENCYE